MVVDCLTDRLGSEPILSIKRTVSIGAILNFDGDFDGHSDGTCKQALMPVFCVNSTLSFQRIHLGAMSLSLLLSVNEP